VKQVVTKQRPFRIDNVQVLAKKGS